MVETPHGVLEMPEFGLSEAERAYHGPPDDRRALMAHRKWLQVLPWLAAGVGVVNELL